LSIEELQEVAVTPSSDRYKNNVLCSGDRWLIWRHGGAIKGKKDQSQSQVCIGCRKYTAGSWSEELNYTFIPITWLVIVQLGTIWKDGYRTHELVLEKARFEVNFDPEHWQISSHAESSEDLYPRSLYSNKYSNDRNKYLELDLNNSGKLLIPCLEFYTKMYGTSSELRRVLAAEGWSANVFDPANPLYAPPPAKRNPDDWVVSLSKKIPDSDAVFLAHALYDPVARTAARSVYVQLESNHKGSSTKLKFLDIVPWFVGPATLKVEGVYFNSGRSFLCLRIVGGSHPTIPRNEIVHDRANSSRVKDSAETSKKDAPWPKIAKQQNIDPIDVTITGDSPPSQNTSTLDLDSNVFEIIGTQRATVAVSSALNASSVKKAFIETTNDVYSAGGEHGTLDNIGRAAINTPIELDSNGFIHELWETLLYLCKKYPDVIRSIESFNYEDGFTGSSPPKLISLAPTKNIIEIYSKQRKKRQLSWPYLIPGYRNPRGLLVVRLKIERDYYYLFEIEPRTNVDAPDKLKKHSGLIAKLSGEENTMKILETLIPRIRDSQGVFKKCLPLMPDFAETYRHVPSRRNTLSAVYRPYEAAMKNAISKTGIQFR